MSTKETFNMVNITFLSKMEIEFCNAIFFEVKRSDKLKCPTKIFQGVFYKF